MGAKKRTPTSVRDSLKKAPTGIQGLDEITNGGLPAGRPTLVCGGAGAGKTLLATEFIVKGATEFNEPGVILTFEENADELAENVRSLGFDLDQLIAEEKLHIDHVHVERSEIEEAGEYDLGGLFVRLAYATESIGAKRVVLDTIEALFAGLNDEGILRAELRRLFRWLKDHELTAVITGEQGERTLTRFGLEEYVADCVILLDNRVERQVSTRRLRVIKYRGSSHGTNEYPFMIGDRGIVVMPITSLRLDHAASTERISLGIPQLDEMFNGGGVFRGSSILVSGAPGTGKSSLAASFVVAACKRGERALLFSYEESAEQLRRNLRSIGLDLASYLKKGLLEIRASRPTLQGLEQHLVAMYQAVDEFKPSVVAVDPMSDLSSTADRGDAKPTLIRLVDHMKRQQITALFTTLTKNGAESSEDPTQTKVSSLMDTWLLLQNIESNGERNRTIFILKSRGMGHSNQVREFSLGDKGIELIDVYLGSGQVLTGTARMIQAENEIAVAELARYTHQLRQAELAGRRKALEAQIAALEAEAAAVTHESELVDIQNQRDVDKNAAASLSMARVRNGRARSK